MADPKQKGSMQEDEHTVDKAEGQRNLNTEETKVTGARDKAEGDRDTIEQDLKQKTGSSK